MTMPNMNITCGGRRECLEPISSLDVDDDDDEDDSMIICYSKDDKAG